MDLFIINRYRDETSDTTDILHQESKRLQELNKKIEERKKAFSTRKEPDTIILKVDDKITPVRSSNEHDKYSTGKNTNIASQKELLIDNEQPVVTTNVKKDKTSTEFKVLGANEFEKKIRVQRVLPYWLSHPYSVSTNLQNLQCQIEEQLWLHETLKKTLLNEGVRHLFPVQKEVIPFILDHHNSTYPLWPHDICVSAPTGSGKTLCFVLPIIQVLMDQIGHHIRALVVLPVQELAMQVAKVFRKYCTNTGLKIALLSGSIPLSQEQKQIVKYTETSGYVSEVDIIVCTAGRLVEHLQNTEGFSLKHLKFLVIDEADRIMDHIQNDWLYHMDKHIKLENELMLGKVPNINWINLCEQKPPPHKLLFSATLSQDPEKLDQWGLFQPKLFSAAHITEYEDLDSIRKYTTPAELTEQFITCNPEEKPLILYHLLVEKKWDNVLCFTNAAQSAHRLTVLLNTWAENRLKVAELSALLDRTSRESVLKKFTQSEINVLIGTDALARGIDIPNCNYVISYDPPRNIKTYIHRVGRTGRAGRKGNAVTILLQNQVNLFKELLQAGGRSELPQLEIKPKINDSITESYEYAIKQTKNLINYEINCKVQKSINLKRGFKSKPKKRKYDTKN